MEFNISNDMIYIVFSVVCVGGFEIRLPKKGCPSPPLKTRGSPIGGGIVVNYRLRIGNYIGKCPHRQDC